MNVNAIAENGGVQFTVSDGVNTYGPFDYGTGGSIDNLAADGNAITLTFSDVTGLNCVASTTVSQVSCSTDCVLSAADPVIGVCNDNGTPSDASDDTYEVEVDASVANGSTEFTVSDGTNTYGPFGYGVGGTISGLPADGSSINLILSDASNPSCVANVEVSQNSCSDACALTITESVEGVCNNNGTISDPSDDFYSVNVNAIAENGGLEFTVSDGTNTWGPFAYGVGGTVTGLPANGAVINLILSDASNTSCVANVEVSQNSCSDDCPLEPLITFLEDINVCSEEEVGMDTIFTLSTMGCDSFIITNHILSVQPLAVIQLEGSIDCYTTSVNLLGEDVSGMSDVSFSWENDLGEILSNESELNTSQPGMYTFNVIDLINGCVSSDSTTVIDFTGFPTADAGDDVFFGCNDEIVVLDGSQSQAGISIVYEWLDNTGNIIDNTLGNTIEVMDIGNYTLVVTDTTNGCQNIDDVNVDFADLILAIDDEFTAIEGEELQGRVTDNDSFNDINNWSITITDNPAFGDLSMNEDGSFTYLVNNASVEQVAFTYEICPENCPENCTQATAKITILLDRFIVPDAFSPNGDGVNDSWVIPDISDYEDNRVVVINRWGSILFETENYNNDWQGTNKSGKPLPEGTYYYLIYLGVVDGNVLKGPLTIVR